MGDQPVARPLPTHRTTQTQNKGTQTFMPWVGFEPMIPVFERAKKVHALDRAATVVGATFNLLTYIYGLFNDAVRNLVYTGCFRSDLPFFGR
jgi:hypothetical protein